MIKIIDSSWIDNKIIELDISIPKLREIGLTSSNYLADKQCHQQDILKEIKEQLQSPIKLIKDVFIEGWSYRNCTGNPNNINLGEDLNEFLKEKGYD